MDDFWQYVAKSFLMSVIYSFLKYVCYRHTQTSTGDVENTQLRFGSPRRDPFLTLHHPCLGFNPYFDKPLG